MKWHMQSKHRFIDVPAGSKASTPSSSKGNTTVPIWSWKLRSEKARNDMFEYTLHDWNPPKSYMKPGSAEAQKIHKAIFEQMLLDLVPFTEVNKPGFLRKHALLCPDFKVASDKYYRFVFYKVIPCWPGKNSCLVGKECTEFGKSVIHWLS